MESILSLACRAQPLVDANPLKKILSTAPIAKHVSTRLINWLSKKRVVTAEEIWDALSEFEADALVSQAEATWLFGRFYEAASLPSVLLMEFATTADDEGVVGRPFSSQDLAEELGVNEGEVRAALRGLKQQGWVTFDGFEDIVLNRGKLLGNAYYFEPESD